MPNPPWPITRLTLREDLAEEFRAKTARLGADSPDVLELLITAFVDEPAQDSAIAAAALRDITEGRSVSVVDAPLPHGSDVAVVRMGPPVDDSGTVVTGGYPRTRRGVSLSSTPAEAWSAGRGYWKLALPGPKHLVVTRLGVVLGIFRTDSWSQIEGGRIWADVGYLLDSDTESVVAVDRSRRRPPAITDEDLAVLRCFAGVTVTYPLDRRGSASYRLDDLSRARRNRAARAQRTQTA